MQSKPANYRKPWTRNELVLALDLYCRIPFHKVRSGHAAVVALSKKLGRTPASVSMKIGNFGAFDETLMRRNISGLTNTSQMDEEIWKEFANDWSKLAVEAALLENATDHIHDESIDGADLAEFTPPSSESEKLIVTKQRLHQSFFRAAVLSSYDTCCCVTGLSIPECLIASHIIPWRINAGLRADPRNGLCLAAHIDRLFDCGLISVDENWHLLVSPFVHQHANEANHQLIRFLEGRPIQLPHRFKPHDEAMEYHRHYIFQQSGR